jgi:hypothetical protein
MAYTRLQVRDKVKQKCNIENTTAQTNSEINDHINEAAAYVHDFLIGVWGEQYARSDATFNTSANTASYLLGISVPDFYKPVRVSLVIDDISYPLERYSEKDNVNSILAESWGPWNLPRYTIILGSDSSYGILFTPTPDATNRIDLVYHTTPPVYTADTDSVSIPHADLLIMQAAINVKFKDERAVAELVAERALIQKRIEDWVGSVDNANVDRTLIIPQRTYRLPYGRLF